jgi:pilus assembly protein Flp/PilA
MLPRLLSVFCRLVRNQRGGTAIEYTLLVALLSVAAVTTLNTLGQQIQNVLTAATNAMN